MCTFEEALRTRGFLLKGAVALGVAVEFGRWPNLDCVFENTLLRTTMTGTAKCCVWYAISATGSENVTRGKVAVSPRRSRG